MLKLAFLWHMHQPYYRDLQTGGMTLPWVRLHSLKDYYDLPARIGKYDRVKATFNLVPSLIEQIELYCDGKTSDRSFDLSKKPVAELSRSEKIEIFDTFFLANADTMIKPYPCYWRLYKKYQDCNCDAGLAVRTSTNQEIRDLIVWANLAWVDPLLRSRRPFDYLFDKGEKYTEEDKANLVNAQIRIMKEIVPTYKSLMEDGKIEISMSPYYHPILPLICDTQSAREALPGIALPKNRFNYPEDAERHVKKAIEMYQDKFGSVLTGMWPSEGSISEAMAGILAKNNIKWMASDEQVLYFSGDKSGLNRNNLSPHKIYSHKTPNGTINIFFRDHTLSDKIGFVYSGWDADKAVNDFINYLYRIRKFLGKDSENSVVSVILDGENCWEYYPDDGNEFLNLLMERLSTDDEIETVTMSEAQDALPSETLTNITAGSWINRNFRIWIGHPEDNLAWDFLWQARRDMKKFIAANPDYNPEKIAAAENSLLIAEGSDWNWWYGDEHRGPQNDVFDRIYRNHLISIYTSLSLKVPAELLNPISYKVPESFITEPEGMITPEIDGKLTHYYEWLGAGQFDCQKAGGAMHRVDRIISKLFFVSDNHNLYFRIDFVDKGFLLDNPRLGLKIEVLNPARSEFLFGTEGVLSLPDGTSQEDIKFGIGDIAEVGIKKSVFFTEDRGELCFRIGIVENDKDIEIWPREDTIKFIISAPGEDVVWDL